MWDKAKTYQNLLNCLYFFSELLEGIIDRLDRILADVEHKSEDKRYKS